MQAKEMNEAVNNFRSLGYEPVEMLCGSIERVKQILIPHIKQESDSPVCHLFGMRVYERKYMPTNRACLVDRYGKVIKILDL